jgi:chromate reductase
MLPHLRGEAMDASVHDIAVVVGSLRRGSYDRMIAKALVGLAPPSLRCAIVEIGDLPLYNQDYDSDGVPAAYTTFRDRIRGVHGVLFVTPEYNRSVPGVLKNAIDVGSRPYGKSVWSGKPAAIVSSSPGAMGGFGANHHLRQSLVFLDMPAMQQPEAYVGGADKLFDANGEFASESTRAFLAKFMQAFAAWVERFAPH